MVNVFETVPVRIALAVSVVILFLMALLNSAFGTSAEEYVCVPGQKCPKSSARKTVLREREKEGKVMVYGATEESIAKGIIAGFHKNTPRFKVEYLRESTGYPFQGDEMEVNAGRWSWDLLSVGPGYTEVKQAKAAARHYGLVADEDIPSSLSAAIGWLRNSCHWSSPTNQDLVKICRYPRKVTLISWIPSGKPKRPSTWILIISSRR